MTRQVLYYKQRSKPPQFPTLPDPPSVAGWKTTKVLPPPPAPLPIRQDKHFILEPDLLPPVPGTPWRRLTRILPPPPIHLIARRTTAASVTSPPPVIFSAPKRADTLQFHFSGAGSNDGAQTDPDASLGGFRSSTEASRVGVLEATPIPNITIDVVSRNNGAGGATGTIRTVDANTLAYQAPGSALQGPSIQFFNGDTRVFEDGADPSSFVRITRTSTVDLRGTEFIEFTDQLENVFGQLIVTDTQQGAGLDTYRAIILFNDTIATVTGIKLFLDVLGTQAVSSSGQLGASGAGTITGSPNAFCDWPFKGWARIEDSSNVLREAAYYSSRTDSALTVPALGRARLGTSASAGASDDNVDAIPGVRIDFEAGVPLVDGSVQTIADEFTAPTGLSFVIPVTEASGVSVVDLLSGAQGALWIHRETPAGVSAIGEASIRVKCAFTVESVAYSETLAGLYRVADDDIKGFELHVGVGAEPDITGTPDEKFTSLPHTTTFTLTGGKDHFLVTNSRNEFDMVSQSLITTQITLDGASGEITQAPSIPRLQSFVPALAGAFDILGVYFYSRDKKSVQADQWLVFLRTDGTDPDPDADTPTVVAMAKADGAAILEFTTGTFANGTTGKVLLRVRRSADTSDSKSSRILTAVADAVAPITPEGGAFFRKRAEDIQ